MKYKELKKLFSDHESHYPQSHLTGYITFSSFGPANQEEYPWESRTYLVSSDNKAFQPNKGGYSIFGCCLDGSDQGVRLEQYIQEEYGGKDGWVVEDCYIVGHLLIECSDLSISEPSFFCTLDDAQEYMLLQLARKGNLDFNQPEFATYKNCKPHNCCKKIPRLLVFNSNTRNLYLINGLQNFHQILPIGIYHPNR